MKSPPELWAQCSDPASLARHLSGFGEISITRLEPESTVAWEGESVSGTVTLEASGWGTRVALTVTPPPAAAEVAPGTAPQRQPPILVVTPPAVRGLGARLSRLIRRRHDVAHPAVSPLSAATARRRPPAEPAAPVSPETAGLVAELEAALDSLGAAHHRPYSRS